MKLETIIFNYICSALAMLVVAGICAFCGFKVVATACAYIAALLGIIAFAGMIIDINLDY